MVPLWALFSFSSYLFFSPVFFCLFLAFYFFHFSLFLFMSSFFDFLMFFIFFLLVFLSNFFLLALVSEFNCFLRSRCFMKMRCPDDIGRGRWNWVGPPAWGRACFNSPEWGGKPLACKNGASPDCIIVVACCVLCVVCCCCCCCFVVVNEWLYYC